jgi:hypothetical protein
MPPHHHYHHHHIHELFLPSFFFTLTIWWVNIYESWLMMSAYEYNNYHVQWIWILYTKAIWYMKTFWWSLLEVGMVLKSNLCYFIGNRLYGRNTFKCNFNVLCSYNTPVWNTAHKMNVCTNWNWLTKSIRLKVDNQHFVGIFFPWYLSQLSSFVCYCLPYNLRWKWLFYCFSM